MPIEKQSARRKTPLIKAPRTSARCQPYENLEEEADDSASLRACSATMRLQTSLSMWNESATRARLPTTVPTPSSRNKNAVSTVFERVERASAELTEFQRQTRRGRTREQKLELKRPLLGRHDELASRPPECVCRPAERVEAVEPGRHGDADRFHQSRLPKPPLGSGAFGVRRLVASLMPRKRRRKQTSTAKVWR